MAYCGYIVTLKEKFPHPNADRLVLAKILALSASFLMTMK